MLTFYYKKKSSLTEWVAEKLKEMVVAHKIVEVASSGDLPAEVSLDALPVLTDDHEIWSSQKEIKAFLNQLHGDLKLSHSLQSDACHIDPDNPDECL